MTLQQGAVALAGRQASDGLLLQALPADADGLARRSIGCAKQTGQSKIEQVRRRIATHLMQHALHSCNIPWYSMWRQRKDFGVGGAAVTRFMQGTGGRGTGQLGMYCRSSLLTAAMLTIALLLPVDPAGCGC